MHASLIHDALYQYLDNIPLSNVGVDRLFYHILLEAGMPKPLAKLIIYQFRNLPQRMFYLITHKQVAMNNGQIIDKKDVNKYYGKTDH